MSHSMSVRYSEKFIQQAHKVNLSNHWATVYCEGLKTSDCCPFL